MQYLDVTPMGSGRDFIPGIHNRRRSVRHKVHTPAYARLNDAPGASDTDLSEILNISEQGIAVQAAVTLKKNTHFSLCLDLSETKMTIRTMGQVVWSDASGRAGIYLPDFPKSHLRQLKEWLFVNALLACLERDAAIREAAMSHVHLLPSEKAGNLPAISEAESAADYTTLLAALEAVKREATMLGPDLDAALMLIARRARTFTRSSGAAIALTEGPEMVCRASAGSDAPSLGARLSIGSGFSGECVRSGTLLRCDDSETDDRVDRESCRVLGIRSMVATPIRWNDSVIGLIEVFSPRPFNFNPADEKALIHLASITSSSVYRAGEPRGVQQPINSGSDDEFPQEGPIHAAEIKPLSRTRKFLLIAAAITLVVVMAWLIVPLKKIGASSSQNPESILPAQTAIHPVSSTPYATDSLENLRSLAEHGDATAEFAIGSRYATGEDVPQDYGEAVRWFSMAAEQGHVISQATLGAYFWAGRGVPQDLVKAYFWSVLAQTGGDEASKYRVALLASRMSRAQVVAAQQQANDWIKQHQLPARSSASQ
jgi:putative methionine-R-sulfoxide reductase with GAF domain